MSADADISRRTSLALAGPAGGGTAGKYLPGALTRKRRTALDNVAAAVSGHPVATLTVGFLMTLTFISVFVFMAMTLVLLPVAIAALLLGLGAFVVTYFTPDLPCCPIDPGAYTRLGGSRSLLSRAMTNVADLELPDPPNDKDVFAPPSRAEWRTWLSAEADRSDGLWLVYRKKSSSLDGPLYHELVEESLCFGWIDSVTKRVDDDRLIQWFSPRRKGGIWSALNKERIERLMSQGLMSERGQRVIDEAMADGSWSQYDDVEALVVHEDLRVALDGAPVARDAWEALSSSTKKQCLWQVYSAKRAETRSTRIEALIQELSSGDD